MPDTLAMPQLDVHNLMSAVPIARDACFPSFYLFHVRYSPPISMLELMVVKKEFSSDLSFRHWPDPDLLYFSQVVALCAFTADSGIRFSSWDWQLEGADAI